MNYNDSLEYLYSLRKNGYILNLNNIQTLLKLLGNPQRNMKFIHVAGTNGKGSTCNYIFQILKAHNYQTGLYTSPSLLCFNERIVTNDGMIDDSCLARLVTDIQRISLENELIISEFEAITAMAILYFREQKCDFVILEVGMGGRLDATNFIEAPLLSIICNIGLDHKEYLGNTLEEIALEKAGIIKPNCPTLCLQQEENVLRVIEKVCEIKNSDLYVSDTIGLEILQMSLQGTVFNYKDMKDIKVSSIGYAQIDDVALVLNAIEIMKSKGISFDKEKIIRGIENTSIPGRIEVVSIDPLLIFDGGHNAQAVQNLVDSIGEVLNYKKIAIVLGLLMDKDYHEIIRILGNISDKFYGITPHSHRSLDQNELCLRIQELGYSCQCIKDIDELMDSFSKEKIYDGILVCGSFYNYPYVEKYRKK